MDSLRPSLASTQKFLFFSAPSAVLCSKTRHFRQNLTFLSSALPSVKSKQDRVPVFPFCPAMILSFLVAALPGSAVLCLRVRFCFCFFVPLELCFKPNQAVVQIQNSCLFHLRSSAKSAVKIPCRLPFFRPIFLYLCYLGLLL